MPFALDALTARSGDRWTVRLVPGCYHLMSTGRGRHGCLLRLTMRRQTSSIIDPCPRRGLGLKALYNDGRQAWATLLDAIAQVRLSHDAIYNLCHEPNIACAAARCYCRRF